MRARAHVAASRTTSSASASALRNAGSVAALILTTQTLIAKKPDDYDPTAGPARGGGAELL